MFALPKNFSRHKTKQKNRQEERVKNSKQLIQVKRCILNYGFVIICCMKYRWFMSGKFLKKKQKQQQVQLCAVIFLTYILFFIRFIQTLAKKKDHTNTDVVYSSITSLYHNVDVIFFFTFFFHAHSSIYLSQRWKPDTELIKSILSRWYGPFYVDFIHTETCYVYCMLHK